MPSHRAYIPIEHLKAEIASFPLVSRASLELGITSLDPRLNGDTRKLWRAAEQAFVVSFPSVSIDELVALRDLLWFPTGPVRSVGLVTVLRHQAESILVPGGDALRLRVSSPPPSACSSPLPTRSPEVQARDTWRWTTFAMPADLLLAASPHSEASRVEFESHRLQRLLEAGYAETHLHLGASFDFPLFWASVLYTLATAEIKESDFENPGADLLEGKDLAAWLIRAALTRCLLATYLCADTRSRSAPFREFFEGTALVSVRAKASGLDALLLEQAVHDLGTGRLSQHDAPFADLRALYAELSGVTSIPPPESLLLTTALDPISSILRADLSSGCTPEVAFTRLGLRHIERHPEDVPFATLFLQGLRVRNLLYRHVVQRPLTPGLQWFIRFFDRLRPGKQILRKSVQLEAAIKLNARCPGLRSLEVRAAPDQSRGKVWQTVQAVDEVLRASARAGSISSSSHPSQAPGLEIGVVFHFSRDRGRGARQGMPAAYGADGHANPRHPDNLGGYRFGHFYRKVRAEATALAQILIGFPVSLEIIRGLDVCTDENGVPAWVLAPLFRVVRDAGRQASAVLQRRLGHAVPALRATVHAGEDFPHLMTGLRRIDESIQYLGLGEGDRLGHAVALGTDATAWATGRGHVVMPREERLWDLVWEWTFYHRSGITPPAARIPLLERELARLSANLSGGEPLTPYELECFVEDLHTEQCLRDVHFPDGPHSDILNRLSPRQQRVFRHLTDPNEHSRGQVLEQIFPEREAGALEVLQAGVRQQVASRGIVIEINPSSNLLIGDLSDLKNHPLWKLNPPGDRGGMYASLASASRSTGVTTSCHNGMRGEPDDVNKQVPLSVCIGSDNPMTFATSLPGEYQLLMDAMLSAGLSEPQSLEWLERARRTGIEARFTLPRSGYALHELCTSDSLFTDEVL